MKKVLIAIPLAIIAIPLVILMALSSRPKLTLDPGVTVIGTATPVQVQVADSHGIRKLTAYVEQNGRRYPVYERSNPAHRVFFIAHVQPAQQYTFAAGTKNASGLKDGKATLVVEADSNDFLGSSARAQREVDVVTRPPSLVADGAQHYINQGGSELVTFTVDGYWTDAGVKVGPYRFRSFPLPASKERVSLFAFPWDLPTDTVPVVYATNPAGNEVTAGFWYRVKPSRYRQRDIELTDAFLQHVVNDIDPNGSGDLLERFLKINRDLRKVNTQQLYEMRMKTADHFLWSAPFLRQEAKDESMFADVRTYIYKGKKVDRQVHLGYDLSNVQHTPILAANDGQVIYADRLGIYGNCIVVDHGLGLQTIYGHLSRIDVKPGDHVSKGQRMGLSGETGLAGGDHLHFSMQVDGVQVDPKEWWDPHWIHDRIFSKIQPQVSAAVTSTVEPVQVAHAGRARRRKYR